MPETQQQSNEGGALLDEAEETFGLSDELIKTVRDALDRGETAELRRIVADLHEADVADLLESLNRDERGRLVTALEEDFDAEVLPYLDTNVREEVIEALGPTNLARSLSSLDSDDAVEVFEELDEDFQSRILTALPRAYRHILEESLTFPEESAGRLMQREIISVPSVWTVGQTIDFMRASEDLPQDFYDLYVVDPKHHVVGKIPLSRVMRNRRPARLTEIMEVDLRLVPSTMDQEEVAHLFRNYALVSAPVVDDAGRLIGIITVDDVVDIIDEEAEEDLMALGGVSEVDLYSAVLPTTKLRSTWLFVNLITAILASVVIAVFEDTIGKLVALAVLMPIVASMGGNAGTQTLTVAVRALAMKDLTTPTAKRFITKELAVAAINGVIFAVLTGGVAWIWFGDAGIGVVMMAAMVVNMLVAGLFGTLIPLALDRFKIDPAVASSVFLTTVTDVMGFFTFLGLAAVFLL